MSSGFFVCAERGDDNGRYDSAGDIGERDFGRDSILHFDADDTGGEGFDEGGGQADGQDRQAGNADDGDRDKTGGAGEVKSGKW